jgi:type III secretion system (T3SS) SseB-like protein
MPPPPSPDTSDLCGALQRWAADPGADPTALFGALLAATLLIVIEESTAEGSRVLVVDRDGDTLVAAFTGDAALHAMVRSEPGGRTVPVGGRELCAEVAAKGPDGLIVDPAGPVVYPLTRARCALLASGKVTDDADDADDTGEPLERTSEDFVVGRPIRRLPEPVMEALVRAARQEGVIRAFWFWIKRPNEREPQLAIAVVPPDQALVNRVGDALSKERETLAAAQLPSRGTFLVLACQGPLAEVVKVASELLYEGPEGLARSPE